MPDRNGNPTLRDKYPIRCQICNDVVQPARYDNEELTSEAQSYRVIGMIPTYPADSEKGIIPQCTYAHLSCLAGASRVGNYRRVHMQTSCVYCGTIITATTMGEDEFCCTDCAQRIKHEMRHYEPTDAVRELLANLAALRAQTHTALHDSGSRQTDQTESNRPVMPPKEALRMDLQAIGPFIPTNELGVIFMFGGVISKLHYRMAMLDGRYPDSILVSPSGNAVNTEFEYVSSNFILHGHDPAICDLVICWKQDQALGLPVLALERYYDPVNERWDFGNVNATV